MLAANELYHVGEILFVLLTIAIQTKSRKRDKGRTRLLVLVDKFGSAFIWAGNISFVQIIEVISYTNIRRYLSIWAHYTTWCSPATLSRNKRPTALKTILGGTKAYVIAGTDIQKHGRKRCTMMSPIFLVTALDLFGCLI